MVMQRILIAEDDQIFGEVFQEELSNEGYKTHWVTEGGDAVLDAARDFKPDLITLDIVLPKMTGLETLKLIKGDEQLKHIPVIMQSSLEFDDSIKEALRHGADDYFVKSQHPLKEVVEKVKNRLRA